MCKWAICSLGTVKSSAVSAFDSEEVNEVILDSGSPGAEPQPVRAAASGRPNAIIVGRVTRVCREGFMADSLGLTPGAPVRAPTWNTQAPAHSPAHCRA